MSNFSEVVDPGGVAAFPSTPQVSLEFVPDEWILVNQSALAIDFSFDGVNVHGTLTVDEPNEGLSTRSKNKKLWLRTAGASPSNCLVMANTDV